ncbi:NBR1-Ig-like domain-containing protein [Actinocorallia aurea]
MREPAADGQGRRGRKARRPDPGEGPVAAFADRLWRLKVEAGDPSFAEMSARMGAAASKSTLAAASQGRTLPSWGTTWEFVRVLAVDRLGREPEETEREWHEDWLRTRALAEGALPETAVGSAPEAAEAVARDADTAQEREETEVPVATTGPPATWRPPAKRSRLQAGTLLAGGALAALVAVAVLVLPGRSDDPAPQKTRMQVDDSVFEGDITIPDGTRIEPGAWFEKVWRLRNTGTVAWHARFLMRVNETACDAPERVEIPPTPPGQSVDIRVLVQAPEEPAACRIYWKMVDLEGRTLFPGKRPIFLDVSVG